jgi:hypothetical protein
VWDGVVSATITGKLRLLEEDVRERDEEFMRSEEKSQNHVKTELRGEWGAVRRRISCITRVCVCVSASALDRPDADTLVAFRCSVCMIVWPFVCG